MGHRSVLSLLAVASLLATACASADDPGPAPERRPAGEYRTGSNIPVKEMAPPLTEEQRQRQADELRRIQQNQAGATSGLPPR